MALRLLLGVEVQPFKQFWVQPPKFIKKFPPGPPQTFIQERLKYIKFGAQAWTKGFFKVFTFVRRRAAFFWLVSWLIYPLGFP